MKTCEYKLEGDSWICPVCGNSCTVEECAKPPVTFCNYNPTIIRKAINYTKAVATHLLTGSNVRDDEEVATLLEICQSCDKYNKEKEFCTICGCKCNKNRSAFLNKLRMKSQVCPLQKWG